MAKPLSGRRLSAILIVFIAACGNATPAPQPPASPRTAPSASPTAETVEPSDGPVPKLRSGALEPSIEPGVRDLHAVGRYVGEGYETLSAEVPDGEGMPSAVVLDVPDGAPAPFAFARTSPPTGKATIWLRRVASSVDGSVTGELFYDADPVHGHAGRRIPFRIDDAAKHASDSRVRLAWLRALAERLGDRGRSAGTLWSVFASGRLSDMADAIDPGAKRRRAAARAPRLASAAPDGELAQLMETTTGATAVQEALQQNRPLFVQAAKEKPSVPLASLKPPALGIHPYAQMLARLGGPAPSESLASSAPADFYYVRAADLTALFALMDQVDSWGSPAANVLDGISEDRRIASRYETALALKRGPLTRALGPSVVAEVAIVGSDPYVKEGSDVTAILRVEHRSLFDAALTATQAELANEHGPLTHETRAHAGVDVGVVRSSDGAVAQQRASVGDIEIVSNSAAAIDAVIDTCQGKRPRLGDEPDFQFMLARDAKTRADVLAYMGDRFVAAVVGPKQKVLEARRQMALGELLIPGFAALLHGFVQGKSPSHQADLVATSFLAKGEMTHAAGGSISWQPSGSAHSSWGTPAALVPLIDFPAPVLATPSERAGYERFARSYQESWSAYVDPIALRVAFGKAANADTMTVDVRQLPLIDATQYQEVADFAGNARFVLQSASSGVRIVTALGRDAEPRKSLESTLHGMSRHDMKLDWIGGWAAVGLADRAEVASALLQLGGDELPQVPAPSEESRRDDLSVITGLPLYAEIAVKSTAQAALALGGLRLLANEVIPGLFEWGEVGRHRDVAIVRISLKKELAKGILEATSDAEVYYAVTGGAIIFAFQEWLLKRLIDERAAGQGPVESAPAVADSTQLSFELRAKPGKGLHSVIAWILEKGLLEASAASSAATAEALFRGAPEIARDPAVIEALALSYFGAAPRTPDGAAYVPSAEGARDPARGTAYAPIWPDVPVAGSPVARVMQALLATRTDISFEDEGEDKGKPMRSLHARAVFDLASTR